jgi:DNA-binding IclR family transcriptional regulator
MLGTLKRAGDVLDLFTIEESEWGATATAQRLGIGKSLAHDALASLAAIGLLRRVGHGRYRLGWRSMSLASVLLRTSDLNTQARPVVRDLADRGGLAVSLVAWDRDRIIYISGRTQAGKRPPCGLAPGSTLPLDGSAPARVLLASRTEAEIRSLWDGGCVCTRHGTLQELELELLRVRDNGWACDEPGHPRPDGAVAAPVRDSEGDVAAAISLSPTASCPIREQDAYVRIAVAAASRISRRMRQCSAAR